MQWQNVDQISINYMTPQELIDTMKLIKKAHGRVVRLHINQDPIEEQHLLIVEAMKPVLTPEEQKAEDLRKTIEAYSK